MKHRRVVGSSARYAQRGDLWKSFRRTMITGSVAGVLVHRGKKDTTTKSEIFKSYTDKAYVCHRPSPPLYPRHVFWDASCLGIRHGMCLQVMGE